MGFIKRILGKSKPAKYLGSSILYVDDGKFSVKIGDSEDLEAAYNSLYDVLKQMGYNPWRSKLQLPPSVLMGITLSPDTSKVPLRIGDSEDLEAAYNSLYDVLKQMGYNPWRSKLQLPPSVLMGITLSP